MEIKRILSKGSWLFLLLILFCSVSASAQGDGGIRKSTKTETVEGKKFYLHTVEKGQTLYAISRAYGVTVNDILVENPDALNGIKPGQVIRVPEVKTAATKPAAATTTKDTVKWFVHKVEGGQTLYSISKKYNTTEAEILKLNPEAKDGLKIGMELKIPGVQPAIAVMPDKPAVVNDTPAVKGTMKAQYNVAFMMPLQLWNADNIDTDGILKTPPSAEFPQKPKAAVEFYQGALMAIDSMRRIGMKVNVFVYDVDDIDSGKTKKVLDRPEFQNMDLIVGPFSPGPFYEVAEFAAKKHITIVSPLSPANRVLFRNPTSLKAMPASTTQMEQLANHVVTERKTENVLMITSGLLREQKMADAFKDEYNRLRRVEGKDTIPVLKGISGLALQLKKDVNNVIVIPSVSQAFITDLLRQISEFTKTYTITVYGMPQWMEFENLDPEYLQSVNLHFAAPYFVDYGAPGIKRFVGSYRTIWESDPTIYSFAGFDVTLYALSGLMQQGTAFYTGITDRPSEGLQQSFRFTRTDSDSGYENNAVRVVHMADYHLLPYGVEPPPQKK